MLFTGLLPYLRSELSTRSDQCPSAYTAPNGLNFTTYCNVDLPCPSSKPTGCDLLGTKKQASMQDCLNSCALDKAGCYGVSFRTTDGTCYFKGNYTTTNLSSSNTSINSALVDTRQLQPLSDLSCPYKNSLTTTTTRGGMQVEVLCGVEIPTGSFCPWSGICEPHTTTLDDCLNACQAAHPLCTAISWNPDMTQGYGNCYLRQDVNAAVRVPSNAVVMHSARLTSGALKAGTSSVSSNLWNASNGIAFDVSMFDQRTGATNYTAMHFDSLESCMESCAQGSNGSCVGILFDVPLSSGYNNCYLLNGTGNSNAGANVTFAQINAAQTRSNQDDSRPNAGSSVNLAWIAGPVVGGVVLLAVFVTTLGFVAKRRKRLRQEYVYECEEKLPYAETVSHIYEAPDGAVKHGGDNAREAHHHGNIHVQGRHVELPGSRTIYELPVSEEAKEVSRPPASTSPTSYTQSSMSTTSLHTLLLLADSALPLGSFAFSSGLESFLAHNKLNNAVRIQAFEQFLYDSIENLASTALPYMMTAYDDITRLRNLDNDFDASTPCTVARRASTSQGRALLAIWERALIHEASGEYDHITAFSRDLKSSKPDAFGLQLNAHFAPLFGAVCRALAVSRDDAAYLFLLNHAKAVLSAAVRSSVMGPYQSQAILASGRLQTSLRACVGRYDSTQAHGAAVTVPVMDLWMGRHELLYSRIFNS
ncbi:hypothetical protein AMS68_005363 [Peltaster fructicola]|uniref:Apple domain-containing protein n=1 Tax=Peltaster fructicola TaxID=286661 RepID=A0A6H0XYT7_9PEZI|nr:hypothetical protein AMS68_005363 [Peltaster fructicola]